MKKYTNDIKTILEVLSFMLIFLGVQEINNPVLSFVCIGLAMAYWGYNLYAKWEYRKGKADYIHIPTQNDQFAKTTSVTLGLIVLAISSVAIVWTKSVNYKEVLGLAIGSLVLLNGLLDVPKGRMKVETNELRISGLNKAMDVRQLKEITIYRERILLTNRYEEVERVNYLAIDPVSSKLIENYISKKTIDLKVVNHVS